MMPLPVSRGFVSGTFVLGDSSLSNQPGARISPRTGFARLSKNTTACARRSPHSPSGCSLAFEKIPRHQALGRCPKPCKGFALDPLLLRRGFFDNLTHPVRGFLRAPGSLSRSLTMCILHSPDYPSGVRQHRRVGCGRNLRGAASNPARASPLTLRRPGGGYTATHPMRGFLRAPGGFVLSEVVQRYCFTLSRIANVTVTVW